MRQVVELVGERGLVSADLELEPGVEVDVQEGVEQVEVVDALGDET